MLIMFVGLCTVFEIYKIIETLVSRKAPYSMFEACYHFFNCKFYVQYKLVKNLSGK